MPGATVEAMLPNLRAQVASRVAIGATGYWIAASTGQLVAFGNLPNAGSTVGVGLNAPIVGIAGHPSGQGYWLLGRDGGVFTFGTAGFHGSTGAMRLNQPIVGMAPTKSGRGYWLVASDGGVFCFGDAKFYGSTGAMRLNSPVLGLTPTPTGKGYWLYARDGGIFSFGDARFFGSTGGIRLNRPIVGMAARPQGDGYWMVGGRRRHLHLRSRAVPRLGREPAPLRRRAWRSARRRPVAATRCSSPTDRCCRTATCRTSAAPRAASRVSRWGWPDTSSRSASSPGQVEAAIHVAREPVVGVERRAHLAPTVELRVHRRQELAPQP